MKEKNNLEMSVLDKMTFIYKWTKERRNTNERKLKMLKSYRESLFGKKGTEDPQQFELYLTELCERLYLYIEIAEEFQGYIEIMKQSEIDNVITEAEAVDKK